MMNNETPLCHAGKPHEYDELKCSVCGNTKAFGTTEHLLDEIERLQTEVTRLQSENESLRWDLTKVAIENE
jgi:hypothetical protein